MSNETFYCPFMGGNPCLGRKCGCAVYGEYRGGRAWWCGMVPDSYSEVSLPPIDEEEDDVEQHTQPED